MPLQTRHAAQPSHVPCWGTWPQAARGCLLPRTVQRAAPPALFFKVIVPVLLVGAVRGHWLQGVRRAMPHQMPRQHGQPNNSWPLLPNQACSTLLRPADPRHHPLMGAVQWRAKATHPFLAHCTLSPLHPFTGAVHWRANRAKPQLTPSWCASHLHTLRRRCRLHTRSKRSRGGVLVQGTNRLCAAPDAVLAHATHQTCPPAQASLPSRRTLTVLAIHNGGVAVPVAAAACRVAEGWPPELLGAHSMAP